MLLPCDVLGFKDSRFTRLWRRRRRPGIRGVKGSRGQGFGASSVALRPHKQGAKGQTNSADFLSIMPDLISLPRHAVGRGHTESYS